MTRYMISFDAHAMDHIPEEEGPAVGKAAQAHPVQQQLQKGSRTLCFELTRACVQRSLRPQTDQWLGVSSDP